MSQVRFVLSVTLGLAIPIGAFAQSGKSPVTLCIDPEPPPWAYWVRDAARKPTKELTGISVDIIRATFAALGKTVKIIGDLPWARCLTSVEKGQIDFAMDAYFDPERAKRFTYFAHYRTSTPQVFFLRENPLEIRDVADLKKYRGCGLVGWSYVHYGLRPEELDLGTGGVEGLIKKLKAKRCDYFVEELETIHSYGLVSTDYLKDPELLRAPVPGAKAPTSHLITKKGAATEGWMSEWNQALSKIQKSGEAATIWKRHTTALPYRP